MRANKPKHMVKQRRQPAVCGFIAVEPNGAEHLSLRTMKQVKVRKEEDDGGTLVFEKQATALWWILFFEVHG